MCAAFATSGERVARSLESLEGVRTLGFDTAPLIYLIEKHPSFLEPMREVARRVDEGSIGAVASVITLTELLAQPLRHGRTDLVEAYRRLFEAHAHVRVVPIDVAIAVRGAELRARHGLRTPDALQVAAAIQAGCDAFLTNDADMRRVDEARVVLVSDL